MKSSQTTRRKQNVSPMIPGRAVKKNPIIADADRVFQDFTNALAALIAHPETPALVYDAFSDAYTELSNQVSPPFSPEAEAAEIRSQLPQYIQLAQQQERKVKS